MSSLADIDENTLEEGEHPRGNVRMYLKKTREENQPDENQPGDVYPSREVSSRVMPQIHHNGLCSPVHHSGHRRPASPVKMETRFTTISALASVRVKTTLRENKCDTQSGARRPLRNAPHTALDRYHNQKRKETFRCKAVISSWPT